MTCDHAGKPDFSVNTRIVAESTHNESQPPADLQAA